MMQKLLGIIGFSASSALLAACQVETSGEGKEIADLFEQQRSSRDRVARPSLSKEKLAKLRRGNVDLSFRLLEQVANEERNTAISGVSLQGTLGMAHAMAAGETQKNIAESVGFLPDAKDTYTGLNYFGQALASRNRPENKNYEKLELTQVNEVFFRDTMTPGKGFLDLLAENFGAGVSKVDFSKDAQSTIDKINGWVSDQTKNTIPLVLSPSDINDQSQWLLVNALYLRAPWAHTFREPVLRPFTTAKGEEIEHPTFRDHSMGGECGKDELARWAFLPTSDEEISVLIILPEQGSIKELLANLDAERLENMAKSSQERSFLLELPQFSVDSGRMDLSAAFKAQGMTAPFAENADFRGHSDGAQNTTPLAKVLHRVVISADRKGISAGAVTVFDGVKAGMGEEDYNMVLNQPFLFAVMDEPTGLALFVGQVVDPRG